MLRRVRIASRVSILLISLLEIDVFPALLCTCHRTPGKVSARLGRQGKGHLRPSKRQAGREDADPPKTG